VRPLPYSHAGARVAFTLLLVVFVLLEWRVRLRSVRNREGVRSDRGSRAFLQLSIIAGTAAGFALAANLHAAAIGVARWPIFVFGLVLMAAGIAIRQWAVALLGPLFTTDVRVHPGQAVVETGPYRWIRHPSYTGLSLIFLGVGVALGNWASLLALAVLPTVGLVVRVRVEERALLDGLGEPYRRFAASRARLVPGVW
jgi:protein-S-isoprenylcysteine O-methyltransferase Ste14